MTHWISFLVFIQSVRLLLSRQISSHYISDQAFNNRLSPVDFLSEQHHSTSIQCALACEKADDCKSYFYNINSSDCKLVSSILNNLNNTTSSIGMKYYIDKSGKLKRLWVNGTQFIFSLPRQNIKNVVFLRNYLVEHPWVIYNINSLLK